MAEGANMNVVTGARAHGEKTGRAPVTGMPLACAGVVVAVAATASLAAAEDVGGPPLRPFTEWRVFLEPSTWVVILAVLVVVVLVRLAVGGRPKTESTNRTGGAAMSSENLTIDEVSEARIEAILARLKDGANTMFSGPAPISEFDLADAFADLFEGAFMANSSAIHRQEPKWHFRPAPGIDAPPEAHVEVRHACMRMILLLVDGSNASGSERERLQRRQAVENVLELASWDPRLSYVAGHSEDRA